jgi:O-antigen/teichoic acid export membrane protein
LFVRNSIAHFVARLLSLGAGLALIPLVTLTLGAEPLGLLGVYATLQGMLALFDLGLPVIVNRQLAILSGRNNSHDARPQLIRSLEFLFWGMTVVFLVTGLLIKDAFSSGWLNAQVLPHSVVATSVIVIIASVAFRFPVAFYSNVLFGLDRHIYPNAVIGLAAILRITVAFVALTLFNVGIVGFFLTQLAVILIEIGLLVSGVWIREVHWNVRPSLGSLTGLFGTAGILTGVSIAGVLLSQIDKIILSKILTLGEFGIYSAAYTLAAGLLALSYPVGNAIFPSLSQSIDQSKTASLARFVRIATELSILTLLPLGTVIITQPQAVLEVLFFVHSFPFELADILPLMVLGALAHSFVTVPHMFMFAQNKAIVALWINVLLIVPYVILLELCLKLLGIWGAALAFAILNIARLIVYWTSLLRGETGALWRPIPLLVIASAGICLLAGWAAGLLPTWPPLGQLLAAATWVALTAALVLALPASRRRVLSYFNFA